MTDIPPTDGVPTAEHIIDVPHGEWTISARLLGGVVVRCGARVRLDGEVRGPVTVEHGAYAMFSGFSMGPIHNHGHVRISGHFHSAIVENTGLMEVAVGAIVRNGQDGAVLQWDGSLGKLPGTGVMFIDDEFTEWLVRQPDGTFSRPEPSAS